jgi:P27 family predicted phage terminase small subunit
MGRHPKPAEQRELEGNPGKRPIPASPSYPLLKDGAPDDLGPDGRELWDRVTRANAANGVIQETDFTELLAMCMEWDLYRRAMRVVNQTQETFLVDTKGNSERSPEKVRNPARLIAQAAFDRFDKIAPRFGLTPSDRTRLTFPKDPGEASDPVEAARRSTLKAV